MRQLPKPGIRNTLNQSLLDDLLCFSRVVVRRPGASPALVAGSVISSPPIQLADPKPIDCVFCSKLEQGALKATSGMGRSWIGVGHLRQRRWLERRTHTSGRLKAAPTCGPPEIGPPIRAVSDTHNSAAECVPHGGGLGVHILARAMTAQVTRAQVDGRRMSLRCCGLRTPDSGSATVNGPTVDRRPKTEDRRRALQRLEELDHVSLVLSPSPSANSRS